jgi:hypothetical protein
MHADQIADASHKVTVLLQDIDDLTKNLEALKASKPDLYATVINQQNTRVFLLNMTVLANKLKGFVTNHSQALPRVTDGPNNHGA